MNQETYGPQYTAHLLEQYKLYVKMADQVSARRSQANSFYITVLSALLAILSLALEKIPSESQGIVILTLSLMGGILCYIWSVNIRSYAQLNTGKFHIIHEMEKLLPFACYKEEWAVLGEGKYRDKYHQLTRIEKTVPLLIAIPYLLLFIYSFYALCTL